MPACPICLTSTERKRSGTPYFMCGDCELMFQSPLPPKRYEGVDEIDAAGGSVGHLMSDHDQAVNRSLAASLRALIPATTATACAPQTLDIGAKYPFLARCLQDLGCQAMAIDAIDSVPTYAEVLGVPMVRGDFEEMTVDSLRRLLFDPFGDRVSPYPVEARLTFDLITLIHVFEHLYSPSAALWKLRRLMSETGRVFLRLPSHDVAGIERDFTDHHYGIHPFIYTLESLLALLERTGDLFVVESTAAMEGSGQRDVVLRPILHAPKMFVGMIARNEERDLPRCLASLVDVADELVLVDTGSTDTTLDVALAWGKKEDIPVETSVYLDASTVDEGEWRITDFSKARGEFIRRIEARADKNDRLLWMDADDELRSPRELRRSLYREDADVFAIPIEAGGSRWIHHRSWRVGARVRFQGRCHEYAVIDGLRVHTLTKTSVRHHADPTPGVENSNDRNLRILLAEYEESVNPRTAFYLGQTYKDRSDHQNAAVWFGRRIELGVGFRDEWLFAHLYKARAERAAGDRTAAIATLTAALQVDSHWAEFWMERAYIAYAAKEHTEALFYCQAAEGCALTPSVLWREREKYTDQPARLASWCHEHLGDVHSSLESALAARKHLGVTHDREWDDRIARLAGLAMPKRATEHVAREANEVLLLRPGAIGDVLMTLNVIPALVVTGKRVTYAVHPVIGDQIAPLMRAAGVSTIVDATQLTDTDRARAIALVGYPLAEGYPEVAMRQHLVRYFADELGLTPSAALPALVLDRPMAPLGLPRPYITLQVRAGWSPYKNWPVDRWSAVVQAIAIELGLVIFQIGLPDEPLVDSASHRYMGTPIMTAAALVAGAALHLGVDSFANHLTHYRWRSPEHPEGRQVPSVILFGSTQASASGYPHNRNLSIGLRCQPCFREDPKISRVPRGVCPNPPLQTYAEPRHACMDAISVEAVVDAVHHVLGASAAICVPRGPGLAVLS